jgi:3-dehydroquinate dehydratase type I
MSAARVDNKFCLPLILTDAAEVQSTIESNLERFRFFEVWLDYIEDLDPDFAASLVGQYPNRLVLVFRRQKLEPMKLSREKRERIISSLARKQVLVDLDVSAHAEEISQLHAAGTAVKTILSYHNYTSTPSDTELRSIVARMEGWGAHIVKIATHCKTQRDALRLLSLLIDLRESGRRCIVLGMGKHGVITRIFGTMWGNEVAFTPLEETQRSASGQLTVDKLDAVLQALA